MQKRSVLLVCAFVILFSIFSVSAESIDNEIQKITSYAQEYEIGNIKYVQLILHLSLSRERMNSLLGATNTEMGGILKESQLKQVLGEPTENTKWVWVENLDREEKMSENIPAWRKIIFDGKKIQLWLSAWPNIFIKNNEKIIFYRLNIETQFKKPGEQLDISQKITEIRFLAENYNKNPSQDKAEVLAEKSVSAERAFESFMRQNQEKCEDTMKKIFGSENKRKTEKMFAQEIELYEGDNFVVNARLEMCDECEWSWINLNFWLEGRGPGFREPKSQSEIISSDQFKNLNSDEFKKEISNIIEEIKSNSQQKNYEKVVSLHGKMQALNEAWNQKSNNVWQEVDKIYEEKRKVMSQQEMEEFNRNYGWIREEQKRRQAVNEIANKNYQERKSFYLNLFSNYEKKEFYYSQQEYEKRLVEEFREFGKEICDNNVDDNKNEKIDCSDAQCSGKICGKQNLKKTSTEGNETKEIEITQELYCISGTCQIREETVQEKKIVCGNHICEEDETKETCKEDCSLCKKYEPIECSGIVTFKGKDENNCPLEPICINEGLSCKVNEDCSQLLCGKAECIEETCKTTAFEECKEVECVQGEERIKECSNGEKIIIEKCVDSLWKKTGVDCLLESERNETPITEPIQLPILPIQPTEPIAGNECTVKEDCGNENDVCSNGKCVTLPEAISPEPTEPVKQEPPKKEEQPEQPSQPATEQPSQPTQPATEQPPQQIDEKEKKEDERKRMENERMEREKREKYEQERKEREERERRNNECKDQCNRQCKDSIMLPCVDKCSREAKCTDNKCIDETIKNCENKCNSEKNIDSCINNCEEKCVKGEKIEMQREEERPKEEKAVFIAGGTCRTSGSKTESFIHFDGWGDPFESARMYKQKYYSGGQADWCKQDLENLIKQRKEFESSFNEEFVRWFFEKYLANSAEDWEQHISGIFEMYWKDVENSRQITERLNCLDQELSFTPNLINIKYETDFGKLEFWEEMKTAKLPVLDKEMNIITPYMKIWIFPPKEFIMYEMKKAMANREFPGPSEEKREREKEEGPTAKEREIIKQDKKFMKKLNKIIEKYDGDLDAVIRFTDNEKVVFNLYAKINENEIIKVQPMLPEEVPKEDVRIEIEFQSLYDLIYESEKEMQGERIESPPWSRQKKPIQKVKETAQGIKMYFKVRSMLNSAKITPKESEKDVQFLMKEFFSMMMEQESDREEKMEKNEEENKEINMIEQKGLLDKKEVITGEIISKY